MTIKQAERAGFCSVCGFAGHLKWDNIPCNYRQGVMNYRNVPPGQCAMWLSEKKEAEVEMLRRPTKRRRKR
ncbi:MAG: hypothetical protein GY737_13960 [Desulfobacteraceae bacterium]|nr:hypothetical protein [Desulfobacteraceae bacterium]